MHMRWSALAAALVTSLATTAVSQTWTPVPDSPDGFIAATAEWPSGVGMIARCGEERGLDVLMPLVQSVDQDHVAVHVITGDEEPSEQRWRLSENGGVLFVRQPGWVSRAMLNREPLTILVIPDSGPRQRYELNSPDGESFLAEVLEACGHPLTSPINEDSIILDPDWVRRPNGSALARWYPRRAADNSIDGEAVIQCRVATNGDVEDCIVLSETPEGESFGAATIAISREFRMRPQQVDGLAIGETLVNIPIRWQIR